LQIANLDLLSCFLPPDRSGTFERYTTALVQLLQAASKPTLKTKPAIGGLLNIVTSSVPMNEVTLKDTKSACICCLSLVVVLRLSRNFWSHSRAQELLFFEDLDQRTHLVHQSFGYEFSPFLREAHQFFNCPLLIARLTDSLQAVK
jgi:hypothetical protein